MLEVVTHAGAIEHPTAPPWTRRGGDVKHYFDESFRQLTTATTIPISAVIGPVMDQVVVLLIWLPPSTPNPWSAQIRPNSATINPTVNVTTKVLLI
jgi:hypothetical protein